MHPKRSVLSAALGVIAVATLVACAAPAEPTPEPTPTVDPGPVALAVDEAGERYLSIVCPANTAAEGLYLAFEAGEAEFFAGGAPDPSAVKAAAQTSLEVSRTAAELLGDDYFEWPEDVADDVSSIRDQYLADLSYLNGVIGSATYEDAYYAVRVDDGSTAGASQSIRLELGLSADTTASCVGFEEGHLDLIAAAEERDAAIARQEESD